MQLVILNATGRLAEPSVAQYFETTAICASWPDSRLWCNYIGALAGTVRTTVRAGTLAGALAAESQMYGGSRSCRAGMLFIQESLRMYQRGDSIEHILSKCRHREGRPTVQGYQRDVRPLGGVDERIEPVTARVKDLGFPVGPHRALALEISSYLSRHHGEGMNANGLDSAILSDLGFSPEEAHRIRALTVASGVTACFVDARDRPGLAFLPLQCEDIAYRGPDAQPLPSTASPRDQPPSRRDAAPVNAAPNAPALLPWDRRRGTITSRAGGRRMDGDVIIRGHSFLDDLFNKIGYTQFKILNATGRLIEPKVAEYFDALEMTVSWPEPRIWCNGVGALAGTVHTTVGAGTMAGLLASDSRLYGGGLSSLKGMPFIANALEARRRGDSIEQILSRYLDVQGRPIAPGYVRPVGGGDERIAPATAVVKSLGFAIGPHRALALEISDYLDAHHGEGMNIGGFDCAFLCDQGFSGEEIYRIRSTTNASGITACWTDTRDRPGQAFLPLQCEDIAYLGTSPRPLPPVA